MTPTIEADEQEETIRIEVDGTYSPHEARQLAEEIRRVADKLGYGPRGGGLW